MGYPKAFVYKKVILTSSWIRIIRSKITLTEIEMQQLYSELYHWVTLVHSQNDQNSFCRRLK
jgi:hypothetical protein